MLRTRRSLLFAIPALLAPVASRPAAAAQQLKFNDLYQAGMAFTQTTIRLAGKPVQMRGYMAPPLKAQARFFVLTRLPMSFCPFCETEADWPEDIVLVYTREIIDVVPFNFLISVDGTLDIGTTKDEETGFVSRMRLLEASYERL